MILLSLNSLLFSSVRVSSVFSSTSNVAPKLSLHKVNTLPSLPQLKKGLGHYLLHFPLHVLVITFSQTQVLGCQS